MVNSGIVQRVCLRVGDAACSVIAFIASYEMLPWAKAVVAQVVGSHGAALAPFSPASAGAGMPHARDLIWLGSLVTVVMALALEYEGESQPLDKQKVLPILLRQAAAMAAAVGAVTTVFYAFHLPPYSRIFMCSYIGGLFILTVGFRLIARSSMEVNSERAAAARRTVIAGRPEGIELFLSLTEQNPKVFKTNIAGCLVTGPPPSSLKVPVLGELSRLGDLLIHEPIDEVIVILPNGDHSWLADAIERCDYFRVSLHIVNEELMSVRLNDLVLPHATYPIPTMMLVPEEERVSMWLVWKRLTDIVLSIVALIILAPLMALIAAAIKITTPSLPVFYPWHVVGYRGRRFTGYKFTTMVANADDRKASLAALNEMSGPVFKIRNDPRVTPLGRFLRKYSLNELPQFWSVLKGDMSLVGPRPAGPHELIHYERWHKRKLSVRPGITCFWQVRGRNAISNFDDWVKMDLEYIQKRSAATDMGILVKTLSVVLRGSGS